MQPTGHGLASPAVESRTAMSKSYSKSFKKKSNFVYVFVLSKRKKSEKIVLILKRDEYEIKWSERSLPPYKNGQRRVSPRGVLLSRDKLTVLYLYSFTFHSSLSPISLGSLALFCDPIGKSQMYRIKKFILFDGMAAPLALALSQVHFGPALSLSLSHNTCRTQPSRIHPRSTPCTHTRLF